MDEKIIKEIKEFLWKYYTEEETLKGFATAVSRTFGFIDMPDGRKAQIKVSLELDEEEWEID